MTTNIVSKINVPRRSLRYKNTQTT